MKNLTVLLIWNILLTGAIGALYFTKESKKPPIERCYRHDKKIAEHCGTCRRNDKIRRGLEPGSSVDGPCDHIPSCY
jgi:hypothetical protein